VNRFHFFVSEVDDGLEELEESELDEGLESPLLESPLDVEPPSFFDPLADDAGLPLPRA
jgi:hypothetical protein